MVNGANHTSSGIKLEEQNKKLITLVPNNVAKIGYEFVFTKITGTECESCKVRVVCLDNLSVGKKYVVKEVKMIEHHCPLVGLNAKVVQVELAETQVSIEKSRVIVGATISYSPINCNWKFCKNYTVCVDNGLLEGEKVKIIEKVSELDCPRGFKLARVLVKS
ncbi:hypothetical protein B9Q01_00475 [Candidatus Marsarchaeota G1 archaeon OSP_D]|jgi:Uncharacterized protein conserved in archaea|uniref:UPF0179 protein B9Q01_00475 n=3 Tax=Candidatus Marsarchaeota group 1 TaxID=2203770 RepID=A0A2R6ADT9_9ARCH|nr:MAG: hypothetical protein B9Q01_00475 [Candidatus Marsarchaeota G1 archaeon OSP_D]PSN89585.1 MAG: hypothetical protein B9Q00_00945 [Candidatus Marsarchaeota G1 archaeon OSP_C]